ncbi:hypothetical protein AgCh_001204 [Apium graveolens]
MKVPSDDLSLCVINLGREPGSKAYHLYSLQEKRIYVSNNVIFEENEYWDWKGNDNETIHVEFSFEENLFENEEDNSGNVDDGHSTRFEKQEPVTPLTHDSSTRLAPENYDDSREPGNTRLISEVYNDTEEMVLEEGIFLMGVEESSNYRETANDRNWKRGMEAELDFIDKNGIWNLIELPLGEMVIVAGEATKTVPKEKSDYTAEDIASIAKDAKVRHLLHSAIDNVMSNRVINCKTAKEIWDALEIRCQGTDTIKKNMKTILTQEYEHFNSKANVSLTDLYDRFVKLLNDLSLVNKEYDLEDSNLKFLLALPECWDLKATTIRDNYNLDETTLDEIYGMLKTHELEMEQRSKKKGGKSRTVALKAEEESPKAAISRKDKGKALLTKSDTESSSSESDDDSDSESLPETDAN